MSDYESDFDDFEDFGSPPVDEKVFAQPAAVPKKAKEITIGDNPSRNVPDLLPELRNLSDEEKLNRIIDKYSKKGFHNLSLRELIHIYKTNEFEQKCLARSGKEWPPKYNSMIFERLRKCHFNINLLIRIKKNLVDLTQEEKFFNLIISGDLPRVKIFMDGDEGGAGAIFPNIIDEYGKTGLHYAAQMGYEDISEYLLHSGFQIDAIDNLERTPLHYAAIQGDCVKLLLNSKSNYLLRDNLNRVPCHLAAIHDNCKAMKDFIDYEEKLGDKRRIRKDKKIVNQKDSFGRTILHYAAYTSERAFSCVQELHPTIDNFDMEDDEGHSPIFYAFKRDRYYEKTLKNVYPLLDIPSVEERYPHLKDMKDELSLSPKEELTLKSLSHKQINANISDKADQKWKTAYLKERLANDVESEDETIASKRRLPDQLRSTLKSNYEFDEEEDAEMRSTVLTEETAKTYYAEEIENLKILVHVLNEKLESNSRDYSEQVEEVLRAREGLQRMKALQDENKEIIEDNTILQNKIDDLIRSIDIAYDKIDDLTEELNNRDIDMDNLKDQLPNIQKLEKYKERVKELEEEIDRLKAQMIQQKQQAGRMYKELLDKLEKQKEESGKFSVDYYVLGRFFRQLTTESLSHFRVRLKNQDKKELGTLKYAKVKKVLEDLKIAPQDIPNLLRLAGFYEEDPSDLIYIEEFVLRIKRRRDKIYLLDQELFTKILMQIKERGYTIDQAFKKLDTSNDGNLEFLELLSGFQKLKIKVSKNECKAIFSILDEDNNGYISLEEFKAKLVNLEAEMARLQKEKDLEEERRKAEELKKKQQEEEDENRKLQDEIDRKRREEEERKRREEAERKERNYQTIRKEVDNQLLSLVDKHLMVYREEQRKYNSKKKRKEKAFKETNKVNGELTIRVNNGYDMHDFRKEGYEHYFVTIQLDGTNDNEEFVSTALDFWTDQNFEYEMRIPMLNTKLRKLGYEFFLKVLTSKTKKFDDARLLGQFKVAWNRCYQFPNLFSVFDQFDLTDPEEIVDMKPIQGKVAVQAKFTPIDVVKKLKDVDLDKIDNAEEEEEKSEEPPEELGTLRIQVLSSRAFEKDKKHKLRFYIDGQDTIETTGVQENTKNPKWLEKYSFTIYKPRGDDEFSELIIDDMDADEEDKILHTTNVDVGVLARKGTGKLEKWCSFFNKPKKQLKVKMVFLLKKK
ncbi:unnamed protein product [Moneuplotes crassus]|uniref:Uncharacterized protein n=2 Tax=Euplotes crassus TaxID=5936 RepID=A0AAD1ULW5_EUPCR|nr:unnamed protein product [Moneuplotes crassus]